MISVIIPAFNAAHILPNCLTALANQTVNQPWEVIVVDDGSTDGTSQTALDLGAAAIKHEHRRGAGAARNSGIQQARGDIVCFTDADCEPSPDWLEQMLRPFSNPEIAGCKGCYASRQKEITSRFVQIEYEDKYDLLQQQTTIDFIDTYSAAYRRHLLLEHGGFDERIHFVEDQELSFRLAAQGCAMVFQPEAIVYHLHSNTVNKYFRKKFMIGYWKAQITRRFPERLIKDSHTPQVLKLQMALVALILFTVATAVLLPISLVITALSLLVFMATLIPFISKAWPKDTAVALASPFFLFIRALALGLGYFWGVVRPLPDIQQMTTIKK